VTANGRELLMKAFPAMKYAQLLFGAMLSLFSAKVSSIDCPCDCPNGCRVFNESFGALTDGSGNSCSKDGFGVTGQYGI
jgi:hypothetical protein